MDKNSSSEPTPEQLLQMLDLQIALQRNKRQLLKGGSTARRFLWLFGGLVLLAIGLWLALLFLDSLELPHHAEPPASTLSKESGS